MDFVALLSGGKDSCFNIYKCMQYGHNLVCLANLFPKNDEEINSFMYQSAASSVIPAFAECLGVPLIRQEISGVANNQHMHYNGKDPKNDVHDEVEDLYQLLSKVKQQFPNIKGVSCGAIVSNYQRFRVENVCERLGLTVLSYLWQKDRTELLQEIISNNFEVVLVKVAGAGLDPYKHLGKTLQQLQPTLMNLHRKYGLDLCGEGGEYESLVTNAPIFKKRINIHSKNILLDDEDASVGNLIITEWSTSDNTEIEIVQSKLIPSTTSTSILNETFINAHSYIPSNQFESIFIGSDGYCQTPLLYCQELKLNNAVKDQLKDIFQRLQSVFQVNWNISMRDIIYVHLYIAQMADFGEVNAEYCRWFGDFPPSRSCVQMPLPDGYYVALDVIALRNSYESITSTKTKYNRKVLHVKSMSEWAPLCIGPYCQANSICDSLIYVAGQIPLFPPTMRLLEDEQSHLSLSLLNRLEEDLCLSWRHCYRVLACMESDIVDSLSAICFIAMDSQVTKEFNLETLRTLIHSCGKKVIFADKKIYEEKEYDEDFDVLDGVDDDVDATYYDIEKNTKRFMNIPLTIIPVQTLPRNAKVEIEIVGYKSPTELTSNPKRALQTLIRDWSDQSNSDTAVVKVQCRCIDHALCSGIIEITSFEDNTNFNDIAREIMQGIHNAMIQANIVSVQDHLRQVKVFFPVSCSLDQQSLQSACEESFKEQFNVTDTLQARQMLFIPTIDAMSAIRVVFLFNNLVQLETEHWIELIERE